MTFPESKGFYNLITLIILFYQNIPFKTFKSSLKEECSLLQIALY